jgi:ankyrin repeat protein
MNLSFQSLLAAFLLTGFAQTVLSDEIHDAAWRGDVQRLKLLLKENPKLANSEERVGFRPLYYAIHYHHPEAVRVLLENGADANGVSTNGAGSASWTPIQTAMFSGGPDIVEMLLKHGAKCWTSSRSC